MTLSFIGYVNWLLIALFPFMACGSFSLLLREKKGLNYKVGWTMLCKCYRQLSVDVFKWILKQKETVCERSWLVKEDLFPKQPLALKGILIIYQ